MLEILLIGMFTAFLLAVCEPVFNFIELFINAKILNAVFSLAFSFAANWLIGNMEIKHLILWTIAGGFAGRALLALAERVSTYRPTIINPIN